MLLFFHYYCAALETFIVIAAMTCDTWEADASAVYEIETEEGHLRWLREPILPCVMTELNQVKGFFFYHFENTNDSFKQQAGKYLNALICLPARAFQK